MMFIPHFQEDAAIEFFKSNIPTSSKGIWSSATNHAKLMTQLCFVGFAIIGLTNAEHSRPSSLGFFTGGGGNYNPVNMSHWDRIPNSL